MPAGPRKVIPTRADIEVGPARVVPAPAPEGLTLDERAELEAFRARFAETPEGLPELVYVPPVQPDESGPVPCPLHFPEGWAGIHSAHEAVSCEHGAFPRARHAAAVRHVAAAPTSAVASHETAGEPVDDWSGEDIL